MAVIAARLALLALTKPTTNGKPLVVAIGTKGDAIKGDWHVAFLDPDALRVYLTAAPGNETLQSLFDLAPGAALDDWLTKGAEKVGLSDGSGGKTTPRVDGKEFHLDGIARVHFFRYSDVFMAGGGLPTPLAWLDTAATVVCPDEPLVPIDPTWAVSRLKLDASSAWPASHEGLGSPTLEGFAFVGHVPIAVSAHEQDRSADAGRKRYDMRLFLFAEADRKKLKRKLWFEADDVAQPANRSCRFTRLQLAYSNTDSLHFGASSDKPVFGLHDLTANGGPALSVGVGTEDESPVFALLPAFAAAPPTGLESRRRQAGFREIRCPPLMPGGSPSTHLILRCEINLRVGNATHWAELLKGFASETLRLPPELAHSLQSAPFSSGLSISQEQPAVDAILRLTPSDEVSWIAAARFEPKPRDTSIEAVLAAIVDRDQDAAAAVLRRLRPLSGATMLAGYTVVDQDDNGRKATDRLAWHVVGTLTVKGAPRRRLRPFEATAAPDWAVRARDPNASWRLHSFEPVPTEDPWKSFGKLAGAARPIGMDLSAITMSQGERLGTVPGALAPIDIDTATWQPPLGREGVCYQISTKATPWLSAPASIIVAGVEFELPTQRVAQIITHRVPRRRPDGGPVGPHLLVSMRLDVTRVRPVEQSPLLPEETAFQSDVAHEAAQGLILDLSPDTPAAGPSDADGRPPFTLHAEETIDGAEDQGVVWTLSAVEGASQEPGRLLILDPTPFRIAAVEGLRPETSDTSDHVARCAPEGGVPVWRFRDSAQEVRLLLPAQTLGEAMEKNGPGRKPADIEPQMPAAMRFGSLTRIDLDPTLRDSGSREPGWNLRRLFNRVSDAEPGAVVRDLRVELAYGLLVNHRPVQRTRLAELAGIIGAPPSIAPRRGVPALPQRVKTLLLLESSRIAVDKLWRDHPSEDFETSEGLRFTLRRRDEKGGGPQTPFRFPAPSGYPGAGRADPAFLESFADPNDEAASREAFPGGIPWAFDSANILAECYADPGSTTGRIGGLHFSALGGWGRQRAAFAGGKSVIETETAMGRLSHYKLERLGRIGGLHNRAKHVVIYRRTVVPPAQFYAEGVRYKQDEHAGRAILRKVEEYIDILQPERRYPEDGKASAEAGCLAGARFVTRRIRVDSNWGGDVRDEGWAVPLWQKELANAPPSGDPDSIANLYPKPLIQLVMPGEDGNDMSVDVATPEKLVFYTSTRKSETGDLVDSWHAVEGIDFCDAPAPVVKESGKPGDADLHEGMLPPAPRGGGGHDRLTLDLVDGRLPARLGAGRVTEGPAAVLKNVSISRARARSATSNGAQAGQAAAQYAADLRGQIDRLFGTIPARFDQLARDLLRPGALQNGRRLAKQAVRDCEAHLIGELNRLLEDAAQRASGLGQQIEGSVGLVDLPAQFAAEVRQAAKAEAARLCGRAKAEDEGAVAEAHAELAARAREISGRWRAELDSLARELDTLAVGSPLVGPRQRAKEALNGAIEATKLLQKDAVAELRADIAAAFATITVNLGAVRRALPGVAEEIAATAESARRALVGLQDGAVLIAAIENCTPGTLPEDLKNPLATYVGVLRKAALDAQQAVSRLTTARNVPAAAQAAIVGAEAHITATLTALATLQGAIDKWPTDHIDEAKQKLIAALKAIDTAVSNLRERLNTFITELESTATGALAAVAEALDEAQEQFTNGAPASWQSVLTGSVLPAADKIVTGIGEAHAAAGNLMDEAFSTADAAIVASAKDATARLRAMSAELAAFSPLVDGKLTEARAKLRDALPQTEAVQNKLDAAMKPVTTYLEGLSSSLAPKVEDQAAHLSAELKRAVAGAQGNAAAIEQQIHSLADALNRQIDVVFDQIDKGRATVDALRAEVEATVARQARAITDRVDSVLDGVGEELSRRAGVRQQDIDAGINRARDLYQEGDNVLRLIRAVGEPPKGDTLGFNRPEVAYVFDLVKPVVDVTPVLALANRAANTAAAAGELLGSFGVRTPIMGFAQDCLPAAMSGCSLGGIIPEIAGLKIEELLRQAGFPDLSGKECQGVKITRGFDKEAREAWMRADIDVPLKGTTTIFDFGPVALTVENAQFRAETQMRMNASGRMEKTAKGMIGGDWRVINGGMDVVTFEKTPLLFDDSGKIDFRIATERVILAPSLDFLTNLLAAFGNSPPAGVQPLLRGGTPVGLVARLSMALPMIATGAFSVADLSLGASFAVIAVPEFEIGVTLDLSSRDAPFTLAVWILNGGGYISQRLSYRPKGSVLTYTLDIAICAGTGLAFGFGVVSGGVWLQIGCSVALTWSTAGGGDSTAITVFLLARGAVDVAGLMTANIMLRLEVSYDGAVMLARGTLRLSFRMSMFYTLRVNQSVEYKIAGEKRAEAPAADYAASFG
ncbi:hypothetical protein AncyloWKF20_04340 [Ancylobacter sp. WKF20]|uniref:hypothetical protein n=1 Tax=Ancylobacter sp. WKF20 TaxID=3039801 RepID=UPI00243431B3|nr:hypothetical protein [Ancylobacter sp. WKF20]WGD31065.1 hypothetical protein AncyloWKF20_04340 [Ancylobacter sp. WKF20]